MRCKYRHVHHKNRAYQTPVLRLRMQLPLVWRRTPRGQLPGHLRWHVGWCLAELLKAPPHAAGREQVWHFTQHNLWLPSKVSCTSVLACKLIRSIQVAKMRRRGYKVWQGSCDNVNARGTRATIVPAVEASLEAKGTLQQSLSHVEKQDLRAKPLGLLKIRNSHYRQFQIFEDLNLGRGINLWFQKMSEFRSGSALSWSKLLVDASSTWLSEPPARKCYTSHAFCSSITPNLAKALCYYFSSVALLKRLKGRSKIIFRTSKAFASLWT